MEQSMKPSMAVFERLRKNSEKNHDEAFTRLYRYLLRPDVYYTAYKNLYANNGAGTRGINNDTADGFSEAYIERIIASLRQGNYQPNPVRRTYIAKANGKKRPLGIPTFSDKLVQEVLRMLLESVYEPLFLDTSHGFRPGRSCHTALTKVKRAFPGSRWFVEGDIKGCFDNIDHEVLVGLIGKKLKDARILQLIRSFLKAGYMEDWRHHETYSGTPQGGIISPILANIYLHELDRYVEELKRQFDRPASALYTPEYQGVLNEMGRLRWHIGRTEGKVREANIARWKQMRAELLRTPAKQCDDKRIAYVRYADDFLIGVNGNREDCEWIKAKLTEFVGNELKMELSQEKTLITHSSEAARFLGYDVRVRRNMQVKKAGTLSFTKRTLSNQVELTIPFEEKIERFLFAHGIACQRKDGTLEPCKRNNLLRQTALEIVSSYNAELRGLCNYYGMAANFRKLNYFGYLMEYSCLKTLANKHKTRISKVRAMYKDGKGGWGIPYEIRTGMKRMYFAKYSDCKDKARTDVIRHEARNHARSTTSFESRLKAKVCELCGAQGEARYEIHHVNKVKNLKGKQNWEKVMIAKRRKTLAVCHKCHMAIHHGEKKE